MWLTGVGLAFAQAVVILQPARIFMFHIVVAAISAKRVRTIHGVLRERIKGVLQRSSGLMRGADDLVQHLNPACRAARKHPHLRMSRVLMSLNDFDIPISFLDIDPPPSLIARVASVTVGLVIFVALVVVVLLPEILGDSLMEAIVTVSVNGVIAFFHSLSLIGTIGLPLALGIVIIGGIAWMEYQHYQFLMGTKWSLQKPTETTDIEREVENQHMDLDALAQLDEKMKKMKPNNWKFAMKAKVAQSGAEKTAAQGQKSLLDSVRAATNFRSKALPSMSSLVSKGLLPDIFSPTKKAGAGESDSDVDSLVTGSQVHRKYLRKPKNGEGKAAKSPLDNIRDLEQSWALKALGKTSPSGGSRFRKDPGLDDIVTDVLAERRKKPTADQTTELLSMFESSAQAAGGGAGAAAGNDESDMDADAEMQEKMELRRRRRERRRLAKTSNKRNLNDSPDNTLEGGVDSDTTAVLPVPTLDIGSMRRGSPPNIVMPQPGQAPSLANSQGISTHTLQNMVAKPIQLGGNDESGGESTDVNVRTANRRAGNRFNVGGSSNPKVALGAAGAQIAGNSAITGADMYDASSNNEKKTSELADLFSTAADGKDPFGFGALHETVGSNTSQELRKNRKHRRRVKAAGSDLDTEMDN